MTLGQWHEAIVAGDTLLARDGALDATYAAAFLAQVADARGDLETLERCRLLAVAHRDSTNVDLGFSAGLVLARCALVGDDPGATLELARPLLAARPSDREMIAEAYELCLEAAMATGDEDVLSALEAQVDALAPNARTPVFRAGQARIIARRLAGTDADRSEAYEREAIALLRDVGARPLLARALLERAGRREDPDALAEARALCRELGASRWLARSQQTVA